MLDEMKAMRNIKIEISGRCNAKCKYCNGGNGNSIQGGYIEIPVFEKIIQKILKLKIYKKSYTKLELFNRGEPFLHPKYNEIVEILNKYEILYCLSTNASILKEINEPFLRNLEYMLISMPGFSQASYDRIHKFNFEKIKANIETVVHKFKEFNSVNKLSISYHIYQFNFDEIEDALHFADELGISITLMYATFVDYYQREAFLNNTATTSQLKEFATELCLHTLINEVNERKGIKSCYFQEDAIAISETGLFQLCCTIPNTHKDYQVGNFLEEDYSMLQNKRLNSLFCNKCINDGKQVVELYREPAFANHLRNAIKMIDNFTALSGYYPDKWCQQNSEFRIRTGELGKVTIKGWYPKQITGNEIISVVSTNGGEERFL